MLGQGKVIYSFIIWGQTLVFQEVFMYSSAPSTQCAESGEVAEWSNAPVLKTGVGLSRPRVRIPASPPYINLKYLMLRVFLCLMVSLYTNVYTA